MPWGTRRYERRSRVPAVVPAASQATAYERISRLQRQSKPGVRLELMWQAPRYRTWEAVRRWERTPDGWTEVRP